ncbi:MAG TPA: nickel pincer cofactor biosynthesis protein LarC, partial [Capsulimonadaceae bacterium]|nr:nickel pincer cofactor biosynthesis protein LarC [Capsulimonadaceae bacterium]
RLAEAEAKIHGVNREEIHFHEVGAVDAIVDIVGCCILLEILDIDQVSASSIPCGYGTITCQHGIMPVPAPATVELLRGFPIKSVDIEGELVTPTGAAIVTTLADPQSAGKIPPLRVLATGFGAGKKKFKKDMPNLLRVIVGEGQESAAIGERQQVCVLETNLDDERPETLGYLMERCLSAGAWDVFFSPITMKKSRPGVMASVLCPPDLADMLAGILFRETGTFGIRIREQERLVLARSWRTASTPYGEIRIKIGSWQAEELTVAPEYEDCRRAAEAHNVSLKAVYQAALKLIADAAAR